VGRAAAAARPIRTLKEVLCSHLTDASGLCNRAIGATRCVSAFAPIPAVTSIPVVPNPGTVTVGGTLTMTAVVNAVAGVAKTVTWTSSNVAFASVNATGVVIGVAPGQVTITACSPVNTSVCGQATITVQTAPAGTISIQAIGQRSPRSGRTDHISAARALRGG
jgi:Big-like domain-containing protein